MAIADESNFDEAFFDEDKASLPKHTMAQVKLELDDRDGRDLISFARTHATAIDGKPMFATPVPTVVEFATKVDEYEGALDDIEEAEAALKQLYARRDI